MISLRKLSILAVLVALGIGATISAPAQGKTAEAKAKPAAETKPKESPWSRKLPEVQFENQALAEVADFLAREFPEINFVVPPNVANVSVTLKLRSVTLDDLFTALEICMKNLHEGLINPATGLAGSLQITKVNERMVSFTMGDASAAAAEKPICRAFSLSRYLANKNEEETAKSLTEIQDALHVCWRMIEDGSPGAANNRRPQLSIHSSTKLLIVVGQSAQVEVVAQVISQLSGEPVMAGYGGVPGAANPFADFYRGQGQKSADPAGRYGAGGAGGLRGSVPGSSPSQNTPPKDK